MSLLIDIEKILLVKLSKLSTDLFKISTEFIVSIDELLIHFLIELFIVLNSSIEGVNKESKSASFELIIIFE